MTNLRAAGGLRPAFDPEAIPLDPDFVAEVRGAPPAAAALLPQALRERFRAPPPWQPEMKADGRIVNAHDPPRPAAVLIPLVMRQHGVTVLLTRRTAHLHDHAGQISFPGGRVEDADADAVATALRETHEEVGLHPRHVDVLGALPRYLTATGYHVTPIVALVHEGFTLDLDTFEVAEVFEPPLAYLMDPAHHERRLVELESMRRTFYAIPYVSGRRYFIWGATAAMLRNLFHLLRA
jgi:8-oxo-dGTP pyrophosphatase MutT (NUDIX family)